MEEDITELNFHMVICQGESSQWCLQTKNGLDKTWSNHYSIIEGLDYQWGYNYFISVNKVKIDNPPQDGSSIKWVLKTIVKKTKVPLNTKFTLDLNGEIPLFNAKLGKIKIIDKEFDVKKSLNISSLKNTSKIVFQFNQNNVFEAVEFL